MANNVAVPAGDHDFVEIDAHLDPPANHPMIHRVVTGPDPHIVVTAQPGAEAECRVEQHRREPDHGIAVLRDAIRRPASQRRLHAPICTFEPCVQLVVEVGRVLEAPARQEAGLEIAVGAFHEALGFGITRLADIRAHAQRAPEGVKRLGECHRRAATTTDRSLTVIDTLAGNATQVEETAEMAQEHVVGFARSAQPPSSRGADRDCARQLQPAPRNEEGSPNLSLGEGQQRRARLRAVLRVMAQPYRGPLQALRYFALDGIADASHEEQARMIRRYIAWRNRNARDHALHEFTKRADVA
jgi:hypothetical protein